MPSGVGAVTVINDPSTSAIPFVVDPASFFELTEKNIYTAHTFDSFGVNGGTENRQLPQAGVLAMIRIMFVGTLTTTIGAGSTTSAARWPYGLLDEFVLSVNAQNDVFSLNGTDLAALRAIRNPGVGPQDDHDTFPGAIGPGNAIATGAQDVVLTWEVPVAIDPTTLIGSVYAQSPAMNLQARFRQANLGADLIAAAGGSTIDSLTGAWSVQVTSYDVPLAPGEQAALIVPDLARLHAVQATQTNFSAVGEVRHTLIRGNGQLDRLLLQYASADPRTDTSADAWYRADPDLDEIDSVRIEYGNAQRPLDYNPAGFLLSENIQDYADRLPYGYVVMDFLSENPPRDIIQMQGVTDLTVVTNINAAAGAPAAGAHVRAVQEMLIG